MMTLDHSEIYPRQRLVSIPLARSAIAGDDSGNVRLNVRARFPAREANIRAVLNCHGISPPLKEGRHVFRGMFCAKLQGWSPYNLGGLYGENCTLYLNILWWKRE